ncbi:hypothetical protein PG984_013089 [Apiospora sp. TS-2023a]
MSMLLDLPDELLLMIQRKILSSRDQFALAATCTKLHSKLGGLELYRQIAAEERAFDEARLKLAHFGFKYGEGKRIKLDFGFWKEKMTWTTARAWNLSKVRPKADDHAGVVEFFEFLDECHDRWGRGMLLFADRQQKDLTLFSEPEDSDPGSSNYFTVEKNKPWERATKYFPETFDKSLIYRAIRGCTDLQLLEKVFDAYLDKYPAAIHGTKHSLVEGDITGAINVKKFNYVNPGDPPVWLACELNRVDALELLHAKGVDINLAKGRLVTEDDWDGTITAEMRWLEEPFDRYNGVLRASAWDQFVRAGRCAHKREDVSLWLAERGLGFPTRPDGLGAGDLVDAAGTNHVRLVRFLLDHLKPKLDREDYRKALNAALREAIRGGNKSYALLDRRGPHDQVFEALLAAGAKLPGPGLLSEAVTYSPSNVWWLWRRLQAEGSLNHEDVRAALHQAILCGTWGNPHRLDFFKAVYPAQAHLACDPAQIATPEGREAAMEELLDSFIRQMRHCLWSSRLHVAFHIVDLLGPERVGENLVARIQHDYFREWVKAWRSERIWHQLHESWRRNRLTRPTPPDIKGIPQSTMLEERDMDVDEELKYVQRLYLSSRTA